MEPQITVPGRVFASIFKKLKEDKNKYTGIYYSPQLNEIVLVKGLCRVDALVCVDRTKDGIFGYYQRIDKFLKQFNYIGRV